jgi:excisionase family DNA binding protein
MESDEHDRPQSENIYQTEDYMTPQAAADYLGVQIATIRKLVERGHLIARRWGNRPLVLLRSSVQQYKATRRGPGRPAL